MENKLSWDAPKVEEFVKTFLSRLAGLTEEQSSNVAETLSHMLRPYFPPASQMLSKELTADQIIDLIPFRRLRQVYEELKARDIGKLATPASTARTDGLSLHKLCHLLNEESQNVMGTHYEQWASGLQRAITLIETGIEGGYVAAKEIASPAAPGSVPQAPCNANSLNGQR